MVTLRPLSYADSEIGRKKLNVLFTVDPLIVVEFAVMFSYYIEFNI